MAKFPQAGRVKTRLQPALDVEQAAAVHRLFLLHLLRRVRSFSQASRIVCVDPPEALESMRELLADASLLLLPQATGELGARMAAAAELILRQHEQVLLLGVDAPDVPLSALEQAARGLSGADIVLGPAADGGYWCLGMDRTVDAQALLRDIEWSSGREYQQTLQRARHLGYKVQLAPPWQDVDHPADLARLVRRLEQSTDCDDKRLLQALSFLPAGVIR